MLSLKNLATVVVGVAVLFASTVLAQAADAPDWPRFHGPNGDNISPDTGLLKKWPEDGPRLIGSVSGIGYGYSGVTISGGMMFTDGNIDDETVITAMDLKGEKLWQTPNGPAYTASKEGSRGTPTLDEGRVYHESPLGEVICLDAKTGEKIWSVNILEEFDAKNITWALAESVLIDGDNVICCPSGPDAAIVALNKKTGQTVWKAAGTGDKAGYASPTVVEYQGLRMILTMTHDALVGVNADTGELLFHHKHFAKYGVNALMPIFHDGQVFISSGYGGGSAMVKIDVDGETATATKVWFSKELDNHHGGVMLLGGYLYGACHSLNNAQWVCLDWKTGERMYSERGVGKGSVTFADGMLYTLSEKRDVGLVKPTPDGHELISEFKIPEGGEGPTWAHPVVCGGRLLIRHADRLFAYDVKGR